MQSLDGFCTNCRIFCPNIAKKFQYFYKNSPKITFVLYNKSEKYQQYPIMGMDFNFLMQDFALICKPSNSSREQASQAIFTTAHRWRVHSNNLLIKIKDLCLLLVGYDDICLILR